MKQTIFQSYTLQEAEETARVWAGLAITALGWGLYATGLRIRAESWNADWAGGIIAGVSIPIVIYGLVFETRALVRCIKHRKAYKKAHPDEFDSAGDPK